MRAPVSRRLALFLFLLPATAAITACAANLIDSSQASPTQPSAASPPPSIRAAHLAVADDGNSRVLIYDAPIGNGASASVVLGQPNFTDSANSGSEAYPNTVLPDGIAMDGRGDLFVADVTHCRVLEFQPPFTTGMNASVAIGWPSLTYTNAPGPFCMVEPDTDPASTLQMPTAVAVDAHGDLWVADSQLAEVLEYVPPFSTGMASSVVLGTGPCEVGRSKFSVPSAENFCEPVGIAFDPRGDMWVADWGFRRIVEFEPPFSTGMAATLEIGEPAAEPFTSESECAPLHSASCLGPSAIAFDAAGDLWATDQYSDRVLEFVPPFANGMAATLVLGQPDFTSYATNPAAADTLNTPLGSGGLWFDSSGDLLVADAGNERILVFTPPFSNDMNASLVIGQPNMTSGGPCAAPATSTLCGPEGILTY